ncbi:unnamed protein product, partial [Heterotrigona itama]
SLEVFEQYGIKHSELLKAQRIAGGSGLGGPLRYQNCILLWLRCDMRIRLRKISSLREIFFSRECSHFSMEIGASDSFEVSIEPRYTETVSGYITISLAVATVTG